MGHTGLGALPKTKCWNRVVAFFETKDKQLKVLLATLEYKARKCKECIERRLAVRN